MEVTPREEGLAPGPSNDLLCLHGTSAIFMEVYMKNLAYAKALEKALWAFHSVQNHLRYI